MRVFYLHLNRADFNISGNGQFWQSDSIDLYYNSSYQNFSLVRSRYGLGAIQPMMGGSTPNNVWVGMNYAAAYPVNTDLYDDIDPYDSWEIYAGSTPNEPIVFTDSGFILNNRFVDTSGPINIVNFNVLCPEYSSDVQLSLFQTESPTSIFPEEWQETNTDITAAQGLYVTNAQRYIMFQLKWNYDPGNIDLYLRIEIGPPVMSPRYAETVNVLGKLPSWMAMSELGEGNPNDATPQLATNTSTGGKLVNALAGEWLDDLRQQVTYRQLQLYINTADIYQKAWLWKSSVNTDWVGSIEGDENICVLAYHVNELLQAQDTEDIVYWDEPSGIIYSNKLYNEFEVNFIQYAQELFHVWNSFDDLGLLVNLSRLPGEGNISFKQRILDVYINPPGAGLLNVENAIRRELNLWQFYGSTPDSTFIGATPNILEIPDILRDPQYMQPNGMPTTKMIRLVNYLAKRYPTTWGEFLWNEAFADLTDDNYSGYGVLPELMDATPWPEAQSGVGDLKDLLVLPPSNNIGPHSFGIEFNVTGSCKQSNAFYAPLELDLTLTPSGSKNIYTNPTITVWLTVVIEQANTVSAFASFQLSSTNNISSASNATPNSSSIAALRLFDSDGGTNPNILFYDLNTGQPIGGRIFTNNISSISLNGGEWDTTTLSYINIPNYSDFNAWFSNNSSDILSASPIVITNNTNASTLPPLTVLMQSTVTQSAIGTWYGEPITLSVTINNSPTSETNPGILGIPNLNWDPALTGDLKLNVQINDINVLNPDNSVTNIPLSSITSGSLIIQTSNVQQSVLESGTLNTADDFGYTFSAFVEEVSTLSIYASTELVAGSSVVYPINQNTSFYFIAPQIAASISGIVDEYGPWIGGYAPSAGNTNYLFGSYTFHLSDFNIPQFIFPSNSPITTLVTGININVIGDDSVTAWLDTNTVTMNADGSFGPFQLYVVLNPNPNAEWNPIVHSGSYFEGNQEKYLFVNPITVTSDTNNTNYFILPSPAQQGAPIIGTYNGTTPMTQVAFFDWNATPNSLTLTNTEKVIGNYTNQLFSTYPNIINVIVKDVTDPNNIINMDIASISSNVINVASPSFVTEGNTYQLTYQVADSFYVNNNYQGATPPIMYGDIIGATPDYTQPPRAIVVSNAPKPWSFTYEDAMFQSSTPVSVALSPFYSPIEEGFIFISDTDYPFDHLIISLSTRNILQDGDYLIANIYAYDSFGNPKPNITFNAFLNYCNFGMWGNNLLTKQISITVDQYGHAVFMINSDLVFLNNNQPVVDVLTIEYPGTNYIITESFNINPGLTKFPWQLHASVAQDAIMSNGESSQLVHGVLVSSTNTPVANTTLQWIKGRSNYDLFAAHATPAASGQVITKSDGTFQIGPFPSDATPGYWLMSIAANTLTPPTGDVVFWLEYPDSASGVGEITGLTDQIIQLSNPVGSIPTYNEAFQHPVYYYNTNPVASSTPNAPLNWIPPAWFPLPVFTQWEYNMFNALAQSQDQDYSNYLYGTLPPNTDYDY